jgi:signal transduction histidine kinase
MHRTSPLRWQNVDLLIPFFVLLILVWYAIGILLAAPYPGFNFNNSTSRVVDIYPHLQQTSSLQVGDKIIRIGSVTWEEYQRDGRATFFEGVQPGDIVEIVVQRNGAEVVVQWEFAGFDRDEFNSRFFNIWWLAFVFWVCGFAAQLVVRPRDLRRSLFIAANYLTALWLIFGSLSSRKLWESSILLHAFMWMLLPVFLHLHWVFPRPLKDPPRAVWIVLYLLGFSLAAGEVAQVLPKFLYAIGFLAALAGSIVLEVVHFARQPDQRREVSLLGISLILAFVPSIYLGLLIISQSVTQLWPLALFSLPFMPFTYFYVIYRRNPGGMKIRLTPVISLYSFLILFGTVLFTLAGVLATLEITLQTSLLIGALAMLVTVHLVIVTFPRYQAFVEERFLGIKLPYQNLVETYASRIITSTSIPSLLQLLEVEVFPSLLIRQYAFMQVADGAIKPLRSANVTTNELPGDDDITDLSSLAGTYMPGGFPPCNWVRLILSLKVGDSRLGFWLLGSRDPDDLYPQEEIPILQAIANQTAIALSNILHSEQLRRTYQMNIERTERERMSLALELHDSILNQIAYLRRSLDEGSLSPQFHAAYEELTHRLREIVGNLRPPMLTYGLKAALEELAENILERSSDKIKVQVDLQDGEERLPEQKEMHIFRIAQQACENALLHAQAQVIRIYGKLTAHEMELCIEDDGKGFDADYQDDLNALVLNNRFGLVGMIERAWMIGAEIQIRSGPRQGTKIRIVWRAET